MWTNLAKFMFSLCLKHNYIIHISHSLSFTHLNPSPTFISFLSFFFSFIFFFGLWIQLQVTHLVPSSSFGLKHRLFMNFARLVYILCSNLMKMVLSKNLSARMNAPFIMQAHHALEKFFSYEKLVWTCI